MKGIRIFISFFVGFISFLNAESNSFLNANQFSSMQLVREMGIGWNLGNALDSRGKDKTIWGNPETTKEMIDEVRKRGFKTLRVPVTWQYHMGNAPDYKIEDAWLHRVKEVVTFGLENNMYVIINIHHDDEWVVPTYAKISEAKEQLKKVWMQIANYFKDYGENLIFETLNEPRLKYSPEEWSGGTTEGRDCVNQLNQIAVQAIRATGGNNSWRHIMLPTYGASTNLKAIQELVLPNFTNIIVSTHNYFPDDFCLSSSRNTWGSEGDKKLLEEMLDVLVDNLLSKNIPLVMGEFGSPHRDNTKDRAQHAHFYVNACLKRGICPIWWDNGRSNQFGLFDRKEKQWFFPEIVSAILDRNEIFNISKPKKLE